MFLRETLTSVSVPRHVVPQSRASSCGCHGPPPCHRCIRDHSGGMRWLPVVALLLAACESEPSQPARTKEQLGQALFDDPRLSEPAGQACSDCHVANAAFADPEDYRTSRGVIRARFGIRNSPSAMYLRFAPPLHDEGGRMVGGLFWDGRAANFTEQAAFPLLNPIEMNNPDKATVVAKIKKHYGRDFKRLFGADIFKDGDKAFAAVG